MCARDVCALENHFRKFLHCKVRKKVYIMYSDLKTLTITLKRGRLRDVVNLACRMNRQRIARSFFFGSAIRSRSSCQKWICNPILSPSWEKDLQSDPFRSFSDPFFDPFLIFIVYVYWHKIVLNVIKKITSIGKFLVVKMIVNLCIWIFL